MKKKHVVIAVILLFFGGCLGDPFAAETQITPDYPKPVIQNPYPDSATPKTDKIAPANPAPPTPSYPDAAVGK